MGLWLGGSGAVVAQEPATPAASQASATFDRAIARARAALAARDLEEATRQLDAAQQAVSRRQQLEEVKQLRALAEQLLLFFDAVRMGLKKYQPAEQIDVDGLVASIVDVRADGATLFVEGARKSYTLATMPANFVLFFARSGADEEHPLAAKFFGAFYLVEGNREKARGAWQRAGSGDADVDELMPLLSARSLTARRAAVPDEKLLAAARIEVQGQFAEEILAAKNAPRRAHLAARFLAAAGEAKDTARQYAALAQARDWAILAGDPAAALAAVDELDRAFDVDGLELKSQVLGLLLAGKLSAKSAAAAAVAAIELSSAAQRAGRADVALSLADTAYNLAREAHDSALIKRAYSRRSESQELERQSPKSKSAR